jgi:CheY-like chemotaxis protein
MKSSGVATVFIVNDDRGMRQAIQDLVESVGLHAESFASGQEFLSNKGTNGPSCLVLDVRLPQMSGLDFQRRLADTGMQIPVIFITAHGDIPMSVRALKSGAVEFLTKPFRDQDLLDASAATAAFLAISTCTGEIVMPVARALYFCARQRLLAPKPQPISSTAEPVWTFTNSVRYSLCYFFRFVAANPVTMMQMFAPKRLVVGADEIIMLDNFLLVLVPQRVGRLRAEWRGAHGVLCLDDQSTQERGSKPRIHQKQ